MKKILALIPLILLFILTSCIDGLSGRVVAVADGDTFTLITDDSIQYKVRLHGVDCPEMRQPHGQKAKEFTSDLIYGKVVAVGITDVDKYDRIVGIVYVDSLVLNEELLSAGYAWHYKQYDDSQWYALLETKAKVRKKGLWIDSHPIAPWDFRKKKTVTKPKRETELWDILQRF